MDRSGSTDGNGRRDRRDQRTQQDQPDQPDQPNQPNQRDRNSRQLVNRRELLTAVGGATAVSTVAATTSTAAAGTATVDVRVYPGPVPLHGWLQSGVAGMHRDWPVPYRDGLAAIESALDRVLAYAADQSRLGGLEITVGRADPVRFPLSETPASSEAVVPTLSTVLDRFRERLRERDVLDPLTCHVLFCWAPLNHRVGYGGTLSPNAKIASTADTSNDEGDEDANAAVSVDGALTVANLGATEIWDSRAVTRNMAIHEALHTVLSSDVAEDVNGSSCDHDLGAAVRTGEDGRTMEVTPMATAYASPERIGAGTRFPGRGCVDHDAFSRHDGVDEIESWTYTPAPSESTLEAVTRYLERYVEG